MNVYWREVIELTSTRGGDRAKPWAETKFMVRGGVPQIGLMFDLSNGSGYVCSAVTGLNCDTAKHEKTE